MNKKLYFKLIPEDQFHNPISFSNIAIFLMQFLFYSVIRLHILKTSYEQEKDKQKRYIHDYNIHNYNTKNNM